MAYNFKKNKFNAIERDKETLYTNNSKISKSNAAFGTLSVNEIMSVAMTDNSLIEWIDIDLIKPRSINDFSKASVETLKESIKELGLFFPILVRTSDNGKYTIISGHRRFQAVKEILTDYKIEKVEKEKTGQDVSDLEDKIKQFSKIKATVFTVVEKGSELLGTSPKYITKEQEEEIYIASNAESRGNSLEGKSGFVVVEYFYNLINRNSDLKTRLLEERNRNAKRKATKLNMPDVIARFITNDLGYPIAPSYVWQVIDLIESQDEYPKYHKIIMDRISKGEKVKRAYKDYKMAVKIHNASFENDEIRKEYATRIEKGNENIEDIYNEAFNIKKEKKIHEQQLISKRKVVRLLNDVINGKITSQEALKQIESL
ncbi:MAG: ParB N-terminal domain-containing protein [Erysipelotrichaceae bacterium]|nr:ParB N-terminal domain-containing protein [Erysipelotrichaceae bacterium]